MARRGFINKVKMGSTSKGFLIFRLGETACIIILYSITYKLIVFLPNNNGFGKTKQYVNYLLLRRLVKGYGTINNLNNHLHLPNKDGV